MSPTQPNLKFLAQLRKRYAKATKKPQSAILDEFVATTGYHRKHASALLSGHRQWRDPKQPIHRPRRSFYTEQDQRLVLWLVELFDDIGSTRRRVAMNTELPNLRKHGHLKVIRTCYQHLVPVSLSTLDRWRRADPKTPYQRMLDAAEVEDAVKAKLRNEHAQWDVVTLKQQLDKVLKALQPTRQ